MTEDARKERRELPPWARRALLLLGGVVVLVVLVLAFRPTPPAVDTATVERRHMEVAVEEDGRTRVRHEYVVSAPLSGILGRVEARAGDPVEEGEALALLRPTAPPLLDPRSRAQAQAGVEAARARLEQARAREEQAEADLFQAQEELRSARILQERAGASRSVVERAEATVRSREADLRSARFGIQVAEQELEHARLAVAQLDGTARPEAVVVRAPASGRVLEVIQESEGVVAPGTPILRVGDTSELEVVVDFLSADAVRIRPGDRARLERWGADGALEARVRTVEPSGFTRISALGIEEQRVNVILDVESPRDAWEALGDGYRVEARVVVWEEEDVLVAPAAAVFRSGEGWAAFRVENGRARLVAVEVGRRSDVEVQVLSGLESGDEVILYPGDRIEDGVRVERR